MTTWAWKTFDRVCTASNRTSGQRDQLQTWRERATLLDGNIRYRIQKLAAGGALNYGVREGPSRWMSAPGVVDPGVSAFGSSTIKATGEIPVANAHVILFKRESQGHVRYQPPSWTTPSNGRHVLSSVSDSGDP